MNPLRHIRVVAAGGWTRLVIIAATALSALTCQLGDLVNPDAPGRLLVSPLLVTDSATVGTAAARTQSIAITSEGSSGTSWQASLSHASAWADMTRSQDTVPATLTLALKPTGLAVGTYKDTLEISSGNRDDVIRIPVSFSIKAPAQPPRHPPSPPTGVGQYRIDGTTAIATGGLTTERTVIFRATLSDVDSDDSLRFEAEVQPLGIPFSNVPNAVSALVGNGKSASAAATGLADYTSYHWQARAADRAGETSAWSSFGGNAEGEADFRVVLPPTRLVFLTEPSSAAAGAVIAPAVRVAVQDAGGSTLSYFNGNVTIAISTNPPGGSLSGTMTVAAVNGIATFSTLRIDRSGTGYTLAASSPGLPGVTSAAFNILAGAATRLSFTVQPASTAAGAPIAPAIRVTALDAQGNVAAGFTGTVTLAIGSNPGAGALSGTTSAAAAAGAATFDNVIVNRAGNGYTLQATAPGLTSSTSAAFNITAPAVSPTLSTVTAAPASIVASNGTATATVTVTARDADGNAIPAVTVALQATGTGNTLAPAGGTTNASGVFTATFSSTFAQAKTITATIGTVTLANTATVNVTPGPATALAFTVQPTATPVAAAITPAVQVTAHDAFGNIVASFAGTVTMALGTNTAGGTLTGTLAVAATGGVATFSNLHIDRAGTGYTLQASSGGFPGATSAAFAVTGSGAVSAGQSTLSATPASVAASAGGNTVAVTVTARDAAGNPVAGATVSLASTGTNNVFTPASGTTSATGVFNATFSSSTAETKTLSAFASGTALTQTATVTVTPGVASALFFGQQPTTTQAAMPITPPVTVTARDAFGNSATGFSGTVGITLGANPGASTLTGSTTAAATGGVATFGDLAISTAGDGYTLVAGATGVTGSVSTAFNITP